MVNSVIRRAIVCINDSKILGEYGVMVIHQRAKSLGCNIEIKDGKLVLTDTKDELKFFLKILDDEAFKGYFTDDIYVTNSRSAFNSN